MCLNGAYVNECGVLLVALGALGIRVLELNRTRFVVECVLA